MPSPRSGFRRESYRNIVVGPGAVVLNYGLPGERLLGATRGGNQFNPGVSYRDIEADKAYGMVKGLRLIDDIQPQIVSNLLEMGIDNLRVALPGLRVQEGTAANQLVPAEYLGAGDGATTAFTTANTPVVAGSLRVYVDGDLQAEGDGNDYTVDLATGTITFAVAPDAAMDITAAYSYTIDGAGTHSILRLGEVADEDYLENVAILGTAMGYNQPFVGIIRNALSEGGIEISLENKNEGVVEVTFTGMFDGQGLEDLALGNATLEEVAPFEIRWPNT